MTHEKNSSLKKQAFLIWLLIILSTGISAVLAFLLYVLPFNTLKHIFDRLSRDGDAKPFTPILNVSLHPAYVLVFLICFVACIFLFLKKRTVEPLIGKLMTWLAVNVCRLVNDSRCFATDIRAIRLVRFEVILLLSLTMMAGWLRLYKINQPMDYDEAFTYTTFVSKSLGTILSNYDFPNNHVLHTILVYIATQITGSGQPWSVRLPAFFAGVLIVPAIYFLTRRLYNRAAAILAACLVVINPFLILYSVNARGYSMLALLTILAFSLGAYLLRCKNLFAWFLLSIICALGFFTVPIMLYPFGCLILWLFFSGLRGDLSQTYAGKKEFWICVLSTSFLTGLFTVLFYSPILIVSGPKSLFANQFVAAMSWDQFVAQLRFDILITWNNNWFTNQPMGVRAVLGLACLCSLLLHRKISSYKVPILVITVIWISLALFVQRPLTHPRIWVFLLPIFLMLSAAGLIAIIQQIQLPAVFKLQPATILSLVFVGGLFFFVSYQSITSPIQLKLDTGDARSTIEYLEGVVKPGDIIIFAFPVDAPLQYYAQILGVPQTYFYIPGQTNHSFDRVFLLVSPQYRQSIESVLQALSFDPGLLNLRDPKIESVFGVYTIYLVYPSS